MPIIQGLVLEGSTIHSDGWSAYDGLIVNGYDHYRVFHSHNEFARGKSHVNGIENFWSFAKRRLAKFNGCASDRFVVHLMEVTKLCISTGELADVVILEENEVLSYAVLGSNIKIGDIPLSYRFSYSISKNGTLRMRIMDVTEQSETTPFIKTINSSDVETYKASVIDSFSSKLKKIGEIVLSRSADFA